jgi:hypothetical protein
LEGLAIEDVGCFYVQLVLLAILWPFGIFYGYLVYCSRFGMLYQEKSGNPGFEQWRSDLKKWPHGAKLCFFSSFS